MIILNQDTCFYLYAFLKSRCLVHSVVLSSRISELMAPFFDTHCTFINLVHLVLVSTRGVELYRLPLLVKTYGLSLYTCCEHVYVQVVMYSML